MNEGDAQALLDLLAGRPSDMELDRAALELARLEYPDLDADKYIGELDHHAAAIADRTRDLSDGRQFIRAANQYLFEELALRGNQPDYYNADNSFLNRVLETKLGIPITLSVIYIEISRRLAKPMSGIGLPGHFVVFYDDGEYSTYVDPFHEGRLLNKEECWNLAQVEMPDESLLTPVSRRSVVMRMVNNLRQVYFSGQEPEKAVRILDLMIAADPENADEHKQRGVAMLRLQRVAESLASFRRYLEIKPDAPDKETVMEQIRSLAFWLASRN